jgi:ABC-type nitrate/sulfonate/bicarbonate transport system permease component
MFLPIIIFWFGIDNTSRVIVIVWAAILPLIINITAGVRNLDSDYTRVATVFCTPRLKFFYAIALPATLPYILAGVRLAVGRALVGAIVAELFLASQGLGYFVQTQTSNFNMDSAMAGIVILAVLALLLNWAVRLVERRFTHWAGAQ